MNIIKPHHTISFLQTFLPPTPIIVEAGAFTGHDSIRMAQRWPHGTIHAFEPVPELYEQLLEKTKEYPNIACHQIGLGMHDGTAQLHLARKPAKQNRITQASSLRAPHDHGNSTITFPECIEIPVITLDTWVDQHHIDHIDLLWLDLQGIELDVLKASPHILKKTRIIHLEVATVERYHNQPLYQEVCTWLTNNNFDLIAQDFDENKATFGNYIARNTHI